MGEPTGEGREPGGRGAGESRGGYRGRLKSLLADPHLRETLDRFARDYPASREAAFAGTDRDRAIEELAAARDAAAARLGELAELFRREASRRGARVYLAADARECREIVAGIAREIGAGRIVKSKSMTCEEIGLNARLAADGIAVSETDLGEWLVQLRGEAPSHMVLPAIHLSRYQADETIAAATGRGAGGDVPALVRLARAALRPDFAGAGMSVTGANLAIASSGTLGIVSNEGNVGLCAALPGTHVAVVGIDKLVPDLKDALRILSVLPRNATGQRMTAYLSLVSGAPSGAGAPSHGEGGSPAAPSGRRDLRVVLLDNGRSRMAADPGVRQILRCVRCGACANVCPVYRMVGGHGLGGVYQGPAGLVLTFLLEGPAAARNIAWNCLGCGACREVCAAAIELPRLIEEIRARLHERDGFRPEQGLLAAVLSRRRLMGLALRAAAAFQGPAVRDGMVRHLPFVLSGDAGFRSLPALADRPFRALWKGILREGADSPAGRGVGKGGRDPEG
ncbi:MAG: LUD domain-containing protein, partial [Deltaproteobacteria bacterium]|nr:LUD domain-containing protein [Deltaproteobacteria bacterium]